jgi:hypothetical protein
VTYPTSDEIRAAYLGINRDGVMAEATVELCALVLRDPILNAIVWRLTHAADRGVGMPVEAAIASAIATGLNYGLRIHEQREAARRKGAGA